MPRRIIRPSAGYDGLRHRAVLREGELRDLLFERSQGTRPRDMRHVPDELLSSTPRFAAYLATHDYFRPRPKTGSSSDAEKRQNRVHAMHRHTGALVLVTSIHHDLAGFPLKDSSTLAAWKDRHNYMLSIIAPEVRAFDGVLQAGGQSGHLHDHTVLPLSDLRTDLQDFVLAARAGPCGGAIHPESGLHLVVMGDTLEDRNKVSSYMTRDPDGRFDLPDLHPDYLQAHEDALLRKDSGVKAPSLKNLHLPKHWR